MATTKFITIEGRKVPVTLTAYRPLAKKVREIIEMAIAQKHPKATTIVHTSNLRGRVHAVVISEAFNRLGEREKQDLVWDALREELNDEERLNISAVVTWSPRELA
jgi:stress-induced morphogen